MFPLPTQTGVKAKNSKASFLLSPKTHSWIQYLTTRKATAAALCSAQRCSWDPSSAAPHPDVGSMVCNRTAGQQQWAPRAGIHSASTPHPASLSSCLLAKHPTTWSTILQVQPVSSLSLFFKPDASNLYWRSLGCACTDGLVEPAAGQGDGFQQTSCPWDVTQFSLGSCTRNQKNRLKEIHLTPNRRCLSWNKPLLPFPRADRKRYAEWIQALTEWSLNNALHNTDFILESQAEQKSPTFFSFCKGGLNYNNQIWERRNRRRRSEEGGAQLTESRRSRRWSSGAASPWSPEPWLPATLLPSTAHPEGARSRTCARPPPLDNAIKWLLVHQEGSHVALNPNRAKPSQLSAQLCCSRWDHMQPVSAISASSPGIRWRWELGVLLDTFSSCPSWRHSWSLLTILLLLMLFYVLLTETTYERNAWIGEPKERGGSQARKAVKGDLWHQRDLWQQLPIAHWDAVPPHAWELHANLAMPQPSRVLMLGACEG